PAPPLPSPPAAPTILVVTSSTNGAATSVGAFTYNPAPTITSVTPSSGPLAGGTSITIAGTNFGGSVTVTVGGIATTGVTVTGGTFIVSHTPTPASLPS